jgi:hypothetical protein
MHGSAGLLAITAVSEKFLSHDAIHHQEEAQ